MNDLTIRGAAIIRYNDFKVFDYTHDEKILRHKETKTKAIHATKLIIKALETRKDEMCKELIWERQVLTTLEDLK